MGNIENCIGVLDDFFLHLYRDSFGSDIQFMSSLNMANECLIELKRYLRTAKSKQDFSTAEGTSVLVK